MQREPNSNIRWGRTGDKAPLLARREPRSCRPSLGTLPLNNPVQNYFPLPKNDFLPIHPEGREKPDCVSLGWEGLEA